MLRFHRVSSAAYARRYYSEWLCRKQWLGPYEREASRWQERLTHEERELIAEAFRQAGTRYVAGAGVGLPLAEPVCGVEPAASAEPGGELQVMPSVAGYDLIFGGPVGVTVLAAAPDPDRRILPAFNLSVRETMQEIEESTRHGLIACSWMHLTAGRAGSKPEPELHSHNFVFDLSYRELAKAWVGVDFQKLQQAASHYDAAFLARLERRMRQLGYEIESDGKGGWDIRGLPDTLLDKFRPQLPLAGCPPLGYEGHAGRRAGGTG